MMKPESRNDQPARVLRFRARRAAPAPRGSIAAPHDDLPVDDLGKYAGGGDDDYRHRMRMNVLAAVVLALLIGGGVWLVDTMAQWRKNQDCLLAGRRTCVPVHVLPQPR